MNFGFDLENTLDAEPEMFRELCLALIRCGNGVYVITAYWKPDGVGFDRGQEALRHSQLDAIGFSKGIHYTDIIFAPGTTTEDQGAWKAMECERMQIALMFEDRQVFADIISKVTRCVMMVPRV